MSRHVMADGPPIGAKTPITLVGCGNMGSHYRRLLQQSDHFELVAVVDPRCETLGLAQDGVLSLRKWDDRIQCSCCVIAAPTESHHDLANRLLAEGLDLLIEKPLCPTHAQSQAVAARAEAMGRTVCCGHIERFNPAFYWLRTRIQSGDLGQIRRMHARRTCYRSTPPSPENNVVVDMALHDLDLMALLVEGLEVTEARLASHRFRHTIDTARIMLEAPGGILATCTADWNCRTGTRELVVVGTRRTATLDLQRRICRLSPSGVPIECDPHVNPLALQLAAFHHALRGEATGICTAREACAVVRLTENALRA